MLPNFLVIGAMKSGSTSLCHNLSKHPDIFVSDPKEPCFFSNDDIYEKGIEWYESLFAEGKNCKAIGEGSVNYTKKMEFPHSVPRIKKHLGSDIKLIYIVRNPLKQIVSKWMHCIVADYEDKPFQKALLENPNYIDSANYGLQLDEYRAFIDEKNILVLFFEDFVKQPQVELRKCYAFLGVDQNFVAPEADKPLNEFSNREGDTVILKVLKKLPFYSGLKQILSPKVVDKLRSVLKWRLKKKPSYDMEVQKYILSHLKEPSRAFLRRYGKPEDFWEGI